MEALAEAVQHLRSLDQLEEYRLELRNDAIASLNLWDVRPVKHFPSTPGRNLWLDPLGQHYVSIDGPNVVSWRRQADDQVIHRWQWPGNHLFTDTSPDGRYLVASGEDEAQGEKPVIRVWDSVTGQLQLERPGPVSHAFRPDGKVLALAQADGSITLYDLSTGQDLPPLPAGPRPRGLRFHPGGQYLAVSRDRPDIEVWDLATGKVAFRLAGSGYPADSLDWSPDGSFLAVAGPDNNIYVSTFPEAKKPPTVLRGHEHFVTGVEFHPSGQVLASSGHDDTMRLWFFPSGGELVLPGEQFGTFSRDGRQLITWCRRRTGFKVWEVASPAVSLHYMPHGQRSSHQPWGLAFAPDGRLLASASQEGVDLLDAATGRVLGLVPSGDGHALAFHPLTGCLFTTDKDGLVRWPILAERDGQALSVGPGTVVRRTSSSSESLRIDVASKGDWLLVGAGDGGLDLVPMSKPSGARRLDAQQALACVALSPDGNWAVSVGRNAGDPVTAEEFVRIWDVTRGIVVQSLPVIPGQHPGAAFSPDGRWLVTGVRSEYCFREVGSWEVKARLPREPRSIHCRIAFSGDGQLLALAQGYNRIELRDAATLRHLATLQSPGRDYLTGLSLSADGTRLAAAIHWELIALWDLRRLRQELAALDLDWEMPPYPSAAHAGEPVQPLTVEVHGVAEQNPATGIEGKDKNKNRPAPEDEKKVITGLYNRYCIRCHGLDGRGVWDIPKVPDFTDTGWQASRSDAQMVRAVLEGGKGTPEKRRDSLKLPPPSKKTGILDWAVMPSFRDILTPEQASGVARYVRTFAPAAETPDDAKKKPSK